jgi:hypothetical protein
MNFGLFTYRRVHGLHMFFGRGPLWGMVLAHRSLWKIALDVPRLAFLSLRRRWR